MRSKRKTHNFRQIRDVSEVRPHLTQKHSSSSGFPPDFRMFHQVRFSSSIRSTFKPWSESAMA
jgi:hypothetical protein